MARIDGLREEVGSMSRSNPLTAGDFLLITLGTALLGYFGGYFVGQSGAVSQKLLLLGSVGGYFVGKRKGK